MSQIKDFEKPLLNDEAKFIENYCSTPSGGFITYDLWQRDYVRDRSTRKIVKKSRRVGFTFADAAQGLYRSQHVIRDSAPYVYEKHFVSRNLNDTREKVAVARYLYDCLPSQRKLRIVSETKTELIFEDYKGRLTRLKAHTANDPRGIGGDISFDEAAFIKNFKKLYAAGQLVTARGGDLIIGSSPGGASGLFFEIFENKGDNYSRFKRKSIPWWLSKSLCIDVLRASIEAPQLLTKDRVRRFGTDTLIGIFETMPLSDFQQECECFYADESATYFPYELLESCEEPDFGTDASDAEVKLLFHHVEDEPTSSFWQWLRSNKRGMLEVGYDVGRKKHVAALVATDTVNGVREVRAVVIMSRKEFGTQEKVIDECIRIAQPAAFRFDATGLGMNLGEVLAKKHGSMFECVNFTGPIKQQMMTSIHRQLEKKTMRMPAWRYLSDNLHSIKKEMNEQTAHITFDSDSSEHHGDAAWALGLTCYHSAADEPKITDYSARGSRIMSNERIPV